MPLRPRSGQDSTGSATTSRTRTVSLGERLAQAVTRWTGSTTAFSIALISVLVWGAAGPAFHWSDTWQLIMNTASSIVTFLMVFLIQRSQNKDTLAIHVKLNELLTSVGGASKGLVSVEDLSEIELQALKTRYQRLVDVVSAEQFSRRPS